MNDSSFTGLILKANEPWRDVNAKLYYEFMETMQAQTSDLQIFDTISDFIQHCTDTLEIIRDMQSKVQNSQVSIEEIHLENERNTWRLIYCLYRNRLYEDDPHSSMETDRTHISEKEFIDNLFKNDKEIREYQLIIDWLEKNALDQAEKEPSVECFTDKTIAWENTLHQLDNNLLDITFSSSRKIVSSLDPDAPIREGKPLHDLDREDDARLEKRMFTEVRCGRLQRAQALAMHCGQAWRAACLMGWQPYHDPNYNNPLLDTKLPVLGNPNRSLWRLNAWALSEDPRIGPYYRGIYASLCGNTKQLLPLAQSWQDALWVHMKVLLDVTVESEVRGFVTKRYTEMPEEYWKNKLKIDDIFDELNSSQNDVVRSQASTPDHTIQKHIILNHIPQLMNEIDTLMDQKMINPQFIRFLSHVVLFFKQTDKICNQKVATKILLAYVRVLMDIGDPILVAYYTAALPPEEQVTNYAKFLESVKKPELREKCLRAAEEANLNVEAATKLVVENIRQKNLQIETHDLKGDITEDDMEKIDALDWLTFYRRQREEALWQTNALIRYFLSCDKIDAAKKAMDKIPQDTISFVMSSYVDMTTNTEDLLNTNNLPVKPSRSIREYLCFKAYLSAQESFREWFSNFHHGKPVPLGELPTYATFTEKVAYDHKKDQYNSDLERWKNDMKRHTAEVKQMLFNVLLFPDGGWLVDPYAFEKKLPSELILRKQQLNKLRELCIPKVVTLLHSVMSEMNEYAECIELADTIACEQYGLYKVFSKERHREFLQKISEFSLVLMDQKKDPWGYSKQ